MRQASAAKGFDPSVGVSHVFRDVDTPRLRRGNLNERSLVQRHTLLGTTSDPKKCYEESTTEHSYICEENLLHTGSVLCR